MQREDDEYFMGEALRVAAYARGRTSPNPLVGAVIVKQGRIVGTGWHRKAGTAHAEIHALQMAGDLARGGTLYVTLEPCAHYGRTGPCAEAVAAAGLKRVVIAMVDPNPLVSGKGIGILKRAGIEVVTGVLEAQAQKINEVFVHWMTRKRPFVLWKTAMTLDGKIAAASGDAKWISNEKSRAMVHEIRDSVDAIMVGIGTELADNPLLTTRLPGGEGKNPVRIIVDSMARTPVNAAVITDKAAKTIIAVTTEAPAAKVKELEEAGAEVLQVNSGRLVDLDVLMQILAQRDICSVLVEGGSQLAFSLLEKKLISKAMVFVAPKIIGGSTAPTPVGGSGFRKMAEAVELEDIAVENAAGDILITGYPKR